ncbi:MAG TPA: cystathionine beta-lyase [Marinilabiliaceae bacterium]|jgi:cystathionine beta-lyase|nr:cystathionine beta-lyase [Marinilabiliaceae bacterium]
MSEFDKIIDRSGTRAIKLEYRERLFGNNDVIPLWVADMDFAAPPAVLKALKERMDHPLYGYSNRPEQFFKAITSWLKRRFDWEVEQSWIEFSPGVVPNLGLAVQAFTQSGEGVIVQPPVYPPFFGVVRDFGRQLIENPLKESDEGYEVDFEHFEELCSQPNNKLFLLCHPHNPVGRVWTPDELRRMGEICVKHGVIIVSDEIHCDLTLFGHLHRPMATISPEIASNTLTCMAPSKTFNLAGFSTSYMIASNPLLLQKCRELVMGYHLHMGNVFGAPALEAAYNESEAWLEELKVYLEGNIDLVISCFKENLPEVKVRRPEATYLLWLDFRAWGMNQNDLKRFIYDKAAVGLNDGNTFGREGRGFMRMNVASPRSIIEKAINRIIKARKEFY